MMIPDMLKLNDWQMRRFTLFVLSILIAYDGIIFTDKFLLKIPFLPQLLGFIILTFIPGFIILRILKIHNLDRILNILLVVGLSMAFSTFLGFFLNEIALVLNFVPISFISLFITYNSVLFILLVVCYFRDSNLNIINDDKNMEINLLQINLLVTIPTLSVLGTYLLNYYNVNYVNILLIIIISLIPFLYKFKELHVILIWISAISILFSTQLVSNYLWSWDIHFQYYVANLIKESGYWESDLPYGVNSLLVIVLLAPIYSILLDLDLVWIYKIIYPFFFSLVPIGIYYLAKMQFNDDKIAFFSPFVFMFYYGFFKDMIDKQYIAEVFLILALILMFKENIRMKNVLVVLFLFMLPLSHYGVSYLFLLSLVFAVFVIYMFKLKDNMSVLIPVLLFVLITSWYSYTSASYTFNEIVGIGYYAIGNLYNLFNPEVRSGMSYLTLQTPSLLWDVYKGIYIALLSFISYGIIKLILSYLKREIICKNHIFGLIAIAFSCFLVYQAFKTLSLAMDRSLQITLILLSSFAFIGFKSIFELVNRVSFKIKSKTELMSKSFSLFLCILFLFSSGLAHEVSGDSVPYAIDLNKDPKWHVYDLAEVDGVKWLKEYRIYNVSVINPAPSVKSRDGTLVAGFLYNHIIKISFNTQKLIDSYAFLGKITKDEVKFAPLYQTLVKSNKIYDSGGAAIYVN